MERNIGLDVLRAIAILLVLIRHSNLENSGIKFFGWLGVDLFFVLSGFLISGLIFKQLRGKNSINLIAFLRNRSLKIFPPFYFLLLFTIITDFLVYDKTYTIKEIVVEFFYLQSYLPHFLQHSWSLAIEEQFYLTFALFIWIVNKSNIQPSRIISISFLIGLLVLMFFLRLNECLPHKTEERFAMFATHLRSDGIIVGIFISYLHHFTDVIQEIKKSKWILLTLSLLLISVGFFFKGGGFVMNTIGLSSVNLGFGGFLVLFYDYNFDSLNKFFKKIIAILSFIGINSYSIYLWHINAAKWTDDLFKENIFLNTTIYLLCSIILGVFFSYLIEKPILKWRKKRFS